MYNWIMANHKIDMTQGSIAKLTILFALPLCLGAILQNFYSLVDTIVVGNFCGAKSIAAVGTSAQPIEILLCVFLGIGGGVSILIAQATGKRDLDLVKHLCSTAVSFLYLTALPLTVIGLFFCPFILRLMQVPEDTLPLANTYIRLVLSSTLGLMGYNLNAGILRGMGDSQSSLIFLLSSCFINVFLDVFFVAILHMNVFGVALATSIATYSSWILSIIYIKKHYPSVCFTVLPCSLDRKLLRQIIKIGLPLGLNSSLYSFGHTFMQAFINSQGANFIAGCTIGSKLIGLSTIAVVAFAQGASTFTAQNYGAQRYDRIKRGGIQIPLMNGLFAFCGNMLMLIFSPLIVRLFTSDPEVISNAIHYVKVVIPFSWCYAIFDSMLKVSNGLGKVKYSTIVNLLTLWAVRIPGAWVILKFFDGYYVMAAIPLSFVFGLCSMTLFYFSKYWREICSKAKMQY